jgi:hypothetical protein
MLQKIKLYFSGIIDGIKLLKQYRKNQYSK